MASLADIILTTFCIWKLKKIFQHVNAFCMMTMWINKSIELKKRGPDVVSLVDVEAYIVDVVAHW